MKLAEKFFNGSLKKRMLWSIIGSVSLLFILAAIISVQTVRSQLLGEKKNSIKAFSEKCTMLLSSNINQSRTQVQTLDFSFEKIYSTPRSERRLAIIDLLKGSLAANTEIVLSLWSDWEPMALDSLDAQKLGTPGSSSSGRCSATTFRKANAVELKNTNGDLDETSLNSEYYTGPKNSKGIYVTKPYLDSYDGGPKILMISVSSPIMVDSKFKGVIGTDINISTINQQIKDFLKEQNGRFFVVDADQNLTIYDKEENVGSSVRDVFANEHSDNKEIVSAVASKTSGFYDYTDGDGVKYIGYVNKAEIFSANDVSILLIPYTFLTDIIFEIVFIGFFMILIALFLLYIVINYIVKRIVDPVQKVTTVLKDLGDGNYDKASEIDIQTNDELEVMAHSLNSLYGSIGEMSEFANAIGGGNLEANLESKGQGDRLGNSLIAMRESLVKASKEERIRKAEDEKQTWVERSVATFGQELRNDTSDTKVLYSNIIRLLVKDLGANQGGLYLINDNEEDNKQFEMVACIAWDRIKMKKSSFLLEEGLLGACYFEKAPIELTEIPDDYISIGSGLGESKPKFLMLVPLIHNEEVIGIIEVASFNKFEDHKKVYLSRIAENFAASIVSINVNARTNQLLSISQMQSEEMQAQEEEMRQNIEELHATQEEMKRKSSKADMLQVAVEQTFISLSISKDLIIIDLNENASSLLGGSVNETVGHSLSSFMSEEELQVLVGFFNASVGGTVVSEVITFSKVKGGEKSIRATLIAEREQNYATTIIGYQLN